VKVVFHKGLCSAVSKHARLCLTTTASCSARGKGTSLFVAARGCIVVRPCGPPSDLPIVQRGQCCYLNQVGHSLLVPRFRIRGSPLLDVRSLPTARTE